MDAISGDLHRRNSIDPEAFTGVDITAITNIDIDGQTRNAVHTVAGADVQHALLKAKRRIRDLSREDPVTGLLNGRAFREVLEHDWAVAARERSALAIVVFELDDFDAYIDVFGRHATDSCLRRVGQAIRRCLRRASDVVGRLDGERLAVLCHAPDEHAVLDFADRISTAVRELGLHHPRSSAGRFVTVSFRVGLAEVADESRGSGKFLDALLAEYSDFYGVCTQDRTDANVADAAEALIEDGGGSLAVVSDRHLIGIITEADFLRLEVERQEGSTDLGETVGDVMSDGVVTTGPDTEVYDAAKMMTFQDIKRLRGSIRFVSFGNLFEMASRSGEGVEARRSARALQPMRVASQFGVIYALHGGSFYIPLDFCFC